MAFYKNVAGQRFWVLAYDTSTGEEKTGDAANITAQISKDGGTSAATDDTNPTELDATNHPGWYYFDALQAETNANQILVSAVSATANVKIQPLFINTDEVMRGTDSALLAASAPTNFSSLGINASGHVSRVTLVDTTTTNTDMVDAATLVDNIWDEPLTAATHNVATSAGKRLRQVSSQIVWDGTAQGSGTGNNQIQLDAGASATDGAYDPSEIFIWNGTGAGQCREILQYNGTTKVATVGRDWKVNPDATSEFVIVSSSGGDRVNEGLAQGGTANTITLNALASSVDGVYVGQIVFLTSGTGQDDAAIVTAYNGTTKVATVDHNWETTPDTTTGYKMLPAGLSYTRGLSASAIDSILDEVLGELTGDAGATPTLRQAIMRRYMEDRNNTTSTATLKTIRNNAGTPIITQVVSDDGTTASHGQDV